MNAERFAAILEAYGAEPRRWPAAERRAAEAFGATPEGDRLLADAASLDEALLAHVVPGPGPELRARVLDAHPRERRGFLGLAPWRFEWAPGAGLAAAGVAGLLFGVVLSHGPTDRRTDALLAETESFDMALLASDLDGDQP
jgi:hypothetical protein